MVAARDTNLLKETVAPVDRTFVERNWRYAALLAAAILLLGLMPATGSAAVSHHRHHRATRHHRRTHKAHRRHKGATRGVTAPGGSTSGSSASGSCPDSGLVPSASNVDRIRVATLCLVNGIRSAHGLVALAPNSALQSVAQRYAQQLVAENFFSHVSPAGATPLTRILASGYLVPAPLGSGFGENLGWADADLQTPAGIVQGWVGSPTHFANMVNPSFRDTGLGITPATPHVLSANGDSATYVEEFGYNRK